MKLIKNHVGVRFGMREVFWRHHIAGPRVLNALQTAGNCVTEWDVDYFNLNLKWPPEGFLAFEYNLVTRASFDQQQRDREDKRGPKLEVPLDVVATIRTLYYNGNATRANMISTYGIKQSTVARILNGSAYWWCGGGLRAWMERWEQL